MATNLHIDESLLTRALKVGGQKTKRDTVNQALMEYVRHREQMKIIKSFGTVDYDKGYDLLAQRRRDRGPRRNRSVQ